MTTAKEKNDLMDEDTRKTAIILAKRLKELRTEKNLTQLDMSVYLDLRPKKKGKSDYKNDVQEFYATTYAGYEAITIYKETEEEIVALNHRFPKIPTLVRMAEVLETTIDYLLGLTDIRHKPEIVENEMIKTSFEMFKKIQDLSSDALKEVKIHQDQE